MHFEKKDQLHSFNILEVIDSQIYGYLNARKLLFWDTFKESTCSGEPNNAEITIVALSSEFPIKVRQIELQDISFGQI